MKRDTRSRRRSSPIFQAEQLEGRQLMTGGAGNTFAILSGNVTNPGGTAQVQFTIDPKQWTLPNHKVTLGIDVAGTSSSTVTPLITGVADSTGKQVKGAYTTIDETPGQSATNSTKSTAGQVSNVVIAPLKLPAKGDAPQTYTVTVTAQGSTQGAFLLGFYLPGDVTGEGTVTQADVKSIRSLNGITATSTSYSLDADSSRNGKIDATDVSLARDNMGVKTVIEPIVSSNLDPANGLDAVNRIGNNASVEFSGQSTPGASITYTNAIDPTKTASTTSDSTGNYKVVAPLDAGSNTFHVTIKDSFGQVISGNISPVTYTSTKVATNPVPSSTNATSTTSSSPTTTDATHTSPAMALKAKKAAHAAAKKAAKA